MPKSSKAKLAYDEKTGRLLRDGKPIGTRNASGYVVLRHEGRVVYAHRLVWFLMYGYWPARVDHINGDRADNRRCNLRDVTATGNAINRRHTYSGAHFHRPSGRWKSAIGFRGAQLHLGYFKTAALAEEAYQLAVVLRNEKEFGHA